MTRARNVNKCKLIWLRFASASKTDARNVNEEQQLLLIVLAAFFAERGLKVLYRFFDVGKRWVDA
jgi:hypothetical protein